MTVELLSRQPHHDGSSLYVSHQCPELGDDVEVFVRVHRDEPVSEVIVRSVMDGEPVYAPAEVDRIDGRWTWWRGTLRVSNPCTSYRFLLAGDGRYRWLNAAGIHDRDVPDVCDYTILAGGTPPGWITDAVAYQVFPDRFARGAEDRPTPPWAIRQDWDDPVIGDGPETPLQWYGGDLAGIEAHLEHLERLHVNVLYLTPIFPGRSNHRYDAHTFEQVDPVLGGDEALRSLIRAAHDRGIRVVGDLTTNHTGDAHDWFRAAQGDPDSVEAGFYMFDRHPDEYATWLGVPSLPKLDWRSDELRRRFTEGPGSIVARWLTGPDGLDGWRVDVANMTGRHGSVDLNAEVARMIRTETAAADPDAWLVAEHAHDATGDLADPAGWHGTMNYAGFTRPVWAWLNQPGHDLDFLGIPAPIPSLPGSAIGATVREVNAQMPWRARLHSMNMLDSHDTPRFRTVVGGDRARQRVGAALMFTMPGVPAVFAGQELGLEGVNGEDSRRPMPWNRPDSWDAATLADLLRVLVKPFDG
jgi:alpha-glucosidase